MNVYECIVLVSLIIGVFGCMALSYFLDYRETILRMELEAQDFEEEP